MDLGNTKTVQTNYGPIVGHKALVTNTFKFLSIPYATAPLGHLRFRPPHPPSSWKEPLIAKEVPASCPQHKNSLAWGRISEDCLYLNIFTPTALPSTPLPVLVWFYGGSWTTGGTSLPLYDGEWDVSGGDQKGAEAVIVVTVNYRLGPFGFLGSAELLEESRNDTSARGDAEGSTGNLGLMDQQTALKWIQREIAAFGGDPSRVTIFGQSAGSGSIAVHLVSPYSQGLFHSAIMQSGPFAKWTSRPLCEAQKSFDSIATAVGCKNSSASTLSAAQILSCLRSASVDALLNAPLYNIETTDWSPVIDGSFLPRDPQHLVEDGLFARVPVLLGTTSAEGTTLLSMPQDGNEDDYQKWIVGEFGAELAPLVNAMYPSANYSKPWSAGVACWTDYGMTCPARRTARWLSRPSDASSVYLYQFTHEPEITKIAKPELGSFHGAELAFVFRILPVDFTPGERKLADAMSAMWRSFAASSDPTKQAMVDMSADAKSGRLSAPLAWPLFSTGNDVNYVFEASFFKLELGVDHDLRSRFCDFWDQHVFYHD